MRVMAARWRDHAIFPLAVHLLHPWRGESLLFQRSAPWGDPATMPARLLVRQAGQKAPDLLTDKSVFRRAWWRAARRMPTDGGNFRVRNFPAQTSIQLSRQISRNR